MKAYKHQARRFYRWLLKQKPRARVGRVFDSNDNPVARYLEYKTGINFKINAICLWVRNGEPTDTPKWVFHFLSDVYDNCNKYVTREKALEILRSIEC